MSTREAVEPARLAARGPRIFRLEAVQRLASSCPCWIVIPSFDVRDYVPSMQLMDSSGVVEMFINKTLSRSTCLAGLLNATRPLLANMSHVPAAFFRSMEYLLEMTESGAFYRPITVEDLTAGAPAPHWCIPLHMQLQQQTSPHGPLQLRFQQHTTLETLAHAALSTAPYWCLMHKYQLRDAKCDFNWAAGDLVAGLVSRSVSPYTLVLGLNMHKDRSMPWMRTCLFMPLAAVLHQHQSGITYVPLGPDDFQTFNTQGFKGGLAAMQQRGGRQQLPVGRDAAGAGSSSSGTHSGIPQRGALAAGDRALPDAAHSHASGRAAGGLGLAGFDMAPHAVTSQTDDSSQTWTTPLFHLLFANTPGLPAMGPPQSWWWLLDSSQQVLQGPFNAEQLLIGYCRGLVVDSTLVCGTTRSSGVEVQPAPPLSCFQPLHTLLADIQQGGAYSLIQVAAEVDDCCVDLPAPAHQPEGDLDGTTAQAASKSSASIRDDSAFQVPDTSLQPATPGLQPQDTPSSLQRQDTASSSLQPQGMPTSPIPEHSGTATAPESGQNEDRTSALAKQMSQLMQGPQ